MASWKVEICLKKQKTHPEHKYSVTFVSKVGTKKLYSPVFAIQKDQPTYEDQRLTLNKKRYSKVFAVQKLYLGMILLKLGRFILRWKDQHTSCSAHLENRFCTPGQDLQAIF